MSYSVTSFYLFAKLPAEEVQRLAEHIQATASRLSIEGLVLLAEEGINATVSGSASAVECFKSYLRGFETFRELDFKDSDSDRRPFRRLSVQVRPEIVALKQEKCTWELLPETYVSPEEWHTFLENNEDVALIDVRNSYEFKLGRFRGACDPELKAFSDFPEYVRQSKLSKDKKVLLYCTGGIRCEKAVLAMREQGFQNVFQLEGGILKYLEAYPHGHFEGECFVFDHRVAVDQELRPSQRYAFCPHCGDPGSVWISCDHCERRVIVCETCQKKEFKQSCSKNCSYHLKRLATQTPSRASLG